MAHDPIRFRLTINLIIFLAVLIFGTIVFMFMENRSFVDAFYYIIVTMARWATETSCPPPQRGKSSLSC